MNGLDVQLDTSEHHRPQTAPGGAAHVAHNSPAPETAWRSRPARLIILCGILLIAAIAVGTGIMLSNLRSRALSENERELQNIAFVLAKQMERDFGAVESVQTNLIERLQSFGIASSEDYERKMSGYENHLMLKDKIVGLHHLGTVALVNSQGRIFNFSRFWPIPDISVADRDFFTALQSDAKLKSVVSKPIRNRATGTWVVQIARKVSGPKGEFLGLVLGAIELQAIEEFFARVAIGPDSSISLLHRDGELMVRYPRVESLIGRSIPNGLAVKLLSNSDHGVGRRIGAVGNPEDCLIAAHRVAHYPLLIGATTNVAAVLADWWRTVFYMIGIAVLAILVVAAGTFLVIRQFKNYAALERARAEKAEAEILREQTFRLDAALNNMSQGLIMFNSERRLVVCNDRYRQMCGLTPDMVRPGCTFLDLLKYRAANKTFSGNLEEYVDNLLAALAQGTTVKNELETADGRTILVTNQPMTGGGWVATHEDVTETRRQDASFRLLFKSNPVPMWVYNLESLRFLAVNDAAVAHYGYSREQFLAMTVMDIRPPEERERFAKFVHLAQGTHQGEQIWRHQKSDKTKIDVAIYSQALSYEGRAAALVASIDVTERKQAEVLIEESHKNLQRAETMARLGHYKFEKGATAVTWSEGLYHIVGKSPETFTPTFSSVSALLHPDDRPALEQYRHDVLSGLELAPLPLRLVKDDGQIVYLENWARPLRASDGSVTGMFGTLQNVTDRKRAEEALALANRELIEKQYAIDQAVNVGVTDVKGNIIYVNDNFCQISGYAREELLGNNHRILNSGTHSETFFRDMYRRITNGQVWRGEICNKAKDGSQYWLDTTIVPQLGLDDKPVAYMAIRVDITDRKRAEDELHKTQNFLNTVIENIPQPIVVKSVPDTIEETSEYRFTLINRAAEELFKVSRNQMIGKNAHDVYAKDHADFVVGQDIEALRAHGAIQVREHAVGKPGHDIRFVTSRKVAIRDDDGKPEYLLSLLEDVTERQRAVQRIAHMAHHDTLTDLPNRAAFNERLSSMLDKAATVHEHFAIMSIDFDRFKEINDLFGHAVGDALLLEVARRMQATAGEAFLARLGGDEFSLIVADAPQPATASALAGRLLAIGEGDFEIEGLQLRMGLSIGVAVYPTDGADAKTLMSNADAALYRAKAEARGSVRFYEPEMDTRLRERLALQNDLRLAIDRGELTLHYQPQLKMAGEPVGFEALVRWQCPKRGMVSPGTFIPIAEESSLIMSIGEWVLREACREAASWPQPLQIAVNISPIQFGHGDLPSVVHSILLETGLAPGRLELEITEGVLINDFSRAVSILRQLKSLGVQIALDDFGTGYSSLSYLHSFAFDKIKIDRAFIGDLERNRHSMAIVRAIIGLGRSLDLPVLAEGVETEAQHAFLLQEGCDEVQGYLTGRPLPIADYAKLVGRQAIADQSYATAG